MVGLIAALNGWIICWGATDWFGALGAFAWLPWAWWGMERALDPARSRWRFLWPAPFVYLLVTGGFPYTVGMLAVVAAWLALKSLGQTRRLWSIWPLVAGLALGFGLSAPAWLALVDYIHGSARGEQANPGSHWQWLVPPAALPGFIWPGWTVRWADFSTELKAHAAIELACGTVPPLALLAGLVRLRGAFVRRMKWELALFCVVLLIAMLPSANVFRWSFRWLPLVHLVLALLAAEALAQFRLRALWRWLAPALVFGSLLLTYRALPMNAGVPVYPFPSSLTNAQPLDPARLYLSIYPPPESAYRLENHPSPLGQLTRPGSTSLWAGVRLVNGYSPIRAAGVGPAWAFYTHGEIDLSMADYLVGYEAGPDGLLAQLGIDGIIVARESPMVLQPASEWKVVAKSAEGTIYHRAGPPFARVRPLIVPNEKSSGAHVRVLEDARQKVVAEIDLPAGDKSTQLVFSRPYFDGYRATLDGKKIPVDSYEGLAPTVQLAAGAHGRLTMVYRPWWLLLGSGLAGMSLVICLGAVAGALRARKRDSLGIASSSS